MNAGAILLVEDSPDDERLVLRALKKANFRNRIDIVRDGVEALDYLLGTGPHAESLPDCPILVLLDLKLPKIDGLEVLRRLRADPRTKCIPVAVLTSSDEGRDIVQSYRLGVNSYVRKPVDFGQFSDTVASLGLYWLLINQPPPTGA